MSLTNIGLCSTVLSKTLGLLTNIPNEFSTTLLFWRPYSLLLITFS